MNLEKNFQINFAERSGKISQYFARKIFSLNVAKIWQK